jgi:hypothetical protein
MFVDDGWVGRLRQRPQRIERQRTIPEPYGFRGLNLVDASQQRVATGEIAVGQIPRDGDVIDDRRNQATREHAAEIGGKDQRVVVAAGVRLRTGEEEAAFADVIPREVERTVSIAPRHRKRAAYRAEAATVQDRPPLIVPLESLVTEPARIEVTDECGFNR